MRLSMDLVPMQTLSLCCTECGQILGKREDQATDREIAAVDCMALGKPPRLKVSTCPKCGQVIVERERQGRMREQFHVRTGTGYPTGDGKGFTDTVEVVFRVPREHKGWESVRYKGKRYQLHGGIRTPLFITLTNPIRKKER